MTIVLLFKSAIVIMTLIQNLPGRFSTELPKPSIPGKIEKIDDFNPLKPKSLISPYSNTAESFIKIMRIKEMIAILRSFDCLTYSPFQ